jgi:pimeloyl-ACP methyl ester carboxylesterase
MRCLHCIWAVLAVLGAEAAMSAQAPAPAAQTAATAGGSTGYTIFLRGQPIGREDVAVRTDTDGITIVSEGRMSSPLNLIIRRAEFKYRPDWTPVSFALDADVAGADVLLNTTFSGGMAVSEGTQSGKPFALSHAVGTQPIVHANSVFGSYAALARRLATASAGAEFRLYVVPQAEIPVRVASASAERMQIGNTMLNVRRYELVFGNPGGDLAVNLSASADDARLLRLNVPSQMIDVVRVDLASSTSRTEIYSNPGDEAVTIPAEGFNLGSTLTHPRAATGVRRPVVILLSGSNVPDREGFALGVPTLGQLAGALADAGFLVVRFDKRGYGQSGGRSESATLQDHAEDARSVLRWLSRRKDVDPKRIALLGHSDGAWVALLAAGREKKFAAVVSVAGPSSKGSELVLEQQQQALDILDLTPDLRNQRVALQKQIQAAVLTGKGWETVPPSVRKQADTPWFQSLLTFDPAKALDDVRQPLLIVHGDLDRQMPRDHAERLADLARKESKSKSIDLVIVRGVNHLMLPAITGEVAEYATLKDKTVSPDVTRTISEWLTKTFLAIR